MSSVTVEHVAEDVAVVGLSRPEQRNALNYALVASLHAPESGRTTATSQPFGARRVAALTTRVRSGES